MADELPRISLKELQTVLAAGSALVVDTLPPEHYAARHIPGAVNACVYEVTFLQQIQELGASPRSRIVFYGAGPDSLDAVTAAEKLQRAGFADLAVFPGGLQEWRAAGLPLHGAEPDTVAPPHPVLTLERERYRLLPAESAITWTGRNDNGAHWGRLQATAGELRHAGNGELVGSCSLDMRSISNVDLEGSELQPVLEDHLKSDDFFFASLFPTATFQLQRMRPIPNAPATLPNYRIEGELQLRGLARPLELEAHLRNVAEGRLALLAHFDLDRTAWGAVYGSARFFQHLGYHVVHDLISLDVRLVLD